MTWQQWVLAVWFALSALLVVGNIGKARPPATPRSAVISLLFLGGLIALVVTA